MMVFVTLGGVAAVEAPDDPAVPGTVCTPAAGTPGVATPGVEEGTLHVEAVTVAEPTSVAEVSCATPPRGVDPDDLDETCERVACAFLNLAAGAAGDNRILVTAGDALPAADLFWGSVPVWTGRNMGAASGLDADTVDGLGAAAFALAGHDHAGAYLAADGTAVNAALLDGFAADAFALAGHDHAGAYLAADGTAINAALLDGRSADAFALAGHDHAGAYLAVDGTAANAALFDGLTTDAFALAAHGHDGRYFTQAAADARFLARNAQAADADRLDGLDSSAFALGDHLHDGRYFTQAAADGRFLALGAQAADSDALDGLDSSAFALAGHLHDSRYYTKAAADGRYLAKTAQAADADKLDGLDSAAFATAAHAHDGRYFTESEADGRFLGKTAKAADADKLDGLTSSKFLRSDRSDTMNGNLRVTGTVRGDNGLCIGSDCITSWPSAFAQILSTSGKSFEFDLTGGGSCTFSFGYGLASCSVEPRFVPGTTYSTFERYDYLEPGTEIQYVAAFKERSEPYSATYNNRQIMAAGGAFAVYQYAATHGTHPGKMRVSYQRDSDGANVEEDWVTTTPGSHYALGIKFTMRGDSPNCTTCRLVDIELTRNGGATKTVTDARWAYSSALLSTLYESGTTYNAFGLRAAAGKVVYP